MKYKNELLCFIILCLLMGVQQSLAYQESDFALKEGDEFIGTYYQGLTEKTLLFNGTSKNTIWTISWEERIKINEIISLKKGDKFRYIDGETYSYSDNKVGVLIIYTKTLTWIGGNSSYWNFLKSIYTNVVDDKIIYQETELTREGDCIIESLITPAINSFWDSCKEKYYSENNPNVTYIDHFTEVEVNGYYAYRDV